MQLRIDSRINGLLSMVCGLQIAKTSHYTAGDHDIDSLLLDCRVVGCFYLYHYAAIYKTPGLGVETIDIYIYI